MFCAEFQILFDFDLLFENANSVGLFSDLWTNIKAEPYKLLTSGVDCSKYPLNDENFIDFLHLLKILPSARCQFPTSVNNFIKISEVMILITLKM